MNGYLWPMLAHAHSVEASDHDTSNDCWMYISTITKDVRPPWIYMFNHHQSFLTQPRRRCRSFECAQVNVMLQAVQCASESPTKYVHALMAALAWDLSSRIFPFGMYISRFDKIYRTLSSRSSLRWILWNLTRIACQTTLGASFLVLSISAHPSNKDPW